MHLRKWMMKSFRLLKKEYNLMPSKSKVQSRIQLTPENYEEILNKSGFTVLKKEIENVNVPLDGWDEISSFKDWIEISLCLAAKSAHMLGPGS